jgi:acyl-CoA thioester hydrolase
MPGFVHCERVRYGDLDANRHLNNVVFQRYFETAWISYRGTLGVPVDPFIETGFELIFAEFHINYRSPVQFDEELDTALTITDIKRSSFRVGFEMRVGERLCAEGYGVYVGFDYEEQRAIPLPESLRARFEGEAVSTKASSANVELIQRVDEAFSRMDADALVALCDPQVEWGSRITAVDEATYRGHEGIRRYIVKLAEVFDWIDVEPLEVLEGGERPVVINRFRALGRGSRVEVEQRFFVALEFRNDKLLQWETHLAKDEALAAVGLTR